MHILIADDERPSREELRYLLERLVPEATFSEATTGEEVLKQVEESTIQVIFLDIRMPGPDGLAVAATILESPDPPLIVFATAYEEHAVQAFELAVLDYVVKPFDERRLARTLERVRLALNERSLLTRRQDELRHYLLKTAPSNRLTKLWGQRENQTWVLVDYRDILWLMALDKVVNMHTASGDELRVHQTLQELEQRLGAYNFARTHKAYLVNLDHVVEVAPQFSGTYVIRMADEARTEIPLSRNYAKHLKRITGWR